MTSIGLFYGSTVGGTQRVGELISRELGVPIKVHDIGNCTTEIFDRYDRMIFGVSTWEGGSMQEDWRAFKKGLEQADLFGKTVALYGLGDQLDYPENFQDGMGELFELLVDRGATVVGRWPSVGYQFEQSSAIVLEKFVGLAIDEANQPDLTEERVHDWAQYIRPKLLPREAAPPA